MGVSRLPNFALPPEGPLHASVACHLHCPSFSVKDPHSQTSGDVSNVSICQIMLAGFTTDHCLIYDHLFRREAMDGLKYYPPEILQIHEKFVYGLRDHMRAVVDICWGKCVRDRMLRTHCPECLQLWGDYQEVSIWLEWEKAANPRLKRFIIFVMHPEAMLYASRMSQGRLQDLHLTAAARIGKIKIDEHFYEYSHRPNTYGRLYRVEWDRQKSLNAQAIAEVRYAVEWRRTNGMNEVKTSIAPLIQNVTFFDFPSTKQDDSSDQSESDNAAENGSSEAYEAVNQASEVSEKSIPCEVYRIEGR